jgi:hypothetical protein
MIQRFIEIGEGFSDLYELIELAKTNETRVEHLLSLDSVIDGKKMTSPVVILSPVKPSNFQPLYICREGIPKDLSKPSKRWQLFEELSHSQKKEILSIEVKHSNTFQETTLFYQYIIGVLRMNRILRPL